MNKKVVFFIALPILLPITIAVSLLALPALPVILLVQTYKSYVNKGVCPECEEKKLSIVKNNGE